MFEIQQDQQSAIGIIVAPERNEAPVYSITNVGMASLAKCDNRGFHEMKMSVDCMTGPYM